MDSGYRAVQTWAPHYSQIWNNEKWFFVHFEGSNYAFTDGHVKWLNKTKQYTAQYNGFRSLGWSPFVGN